MVQREAGRERGVASPPPPPEVSGPAPKTSPTWTPCHLLIPGPAIPRRPRVRLRGRSHDHLPCRPPVAVRLLTLGGAHVEGGGRFARSTKAGAFGLSGPSTCRNVAHFQFVQFLTPSPGPNPHLVCLPPLVLRRVVAEESGLQVGWLLGWRQPLGRGFRPCSSLEVEETGGGAPTLHQPLHALLSRKERVGPPAGRGCPAPSRPAPPTSWRSCSSTTTRIKSVLVRWTPGSC